MLDGDVVVLELDATFVGLLEHPGQVGRHLGVGSPVHLGEFAEQILGDAAHGGRLHVHRLQQRKHDAVGLGNEGAQKVGGVDSRVVASLRLIASSHQRLLALVRQLVEIHLILSI